MNTRTKTNSDGVFVVEVDIMLDVLVTFVFTRKNGPLVYDRCTAAVVISTGQTIRAMYAGNVPDVVLSLAREMALDACAQYDKIPDMQRERGT